ncbi:hypothetical protein Tco_0686772 [Tanacetum coccineum]
MSRPSGGGILSHLLESFGRKEVTPNPWNTTCSPQVLEIFRVPGHSWPSCHFPRLVDLLKSKKDVGMDEVLDCFLLDGPLAELPEAASLQPCIEQLAIPIHHAGDKMAVEETSLSFDNLINVSCSCRVGQ